MDLVLNYEEILPPTLTRKKRESDNRPIPVRKRTRPVDLRVSRSRLSGSIDPQKLLELQLERKEGRSRNSSPNRPTPTSATADQATLTQEARQSEPKSLPEPESIEATSLAAPPGDEDLPPRPNFVEPPPEFEERDGTSPVVPSTPTPPTVVEIAPSPTFKRSESRSPRSGSPIAKTGSTNLKRNVSGESNRLRGPRMARGPRPPSQVLSKTAPTASLGENGVRRDTTAVNAKVLSRRTQESDAEDNVLGR